MKNLLPISLLALCLIIGQWVSAQVNSGVLPKSTVAQLSEVSVPQVDVATPDLAALQAKSEKTIQDGTPLKVAIVMPLQLTTDNAGIWEHTDDGYDVWRLRLHNAKALGCCALFERFQLPEGAQFFAYNNDKSLIYGPYTNEDNPSGEGFSSGLFTGGDVILEYVSPQHQLNQTFTPDIAIAGYTYFYRPEGLPDNRISGTKDGDTGYGASQSCMININCSEGDNWRVQQKGVGRMLCYGIEDGALTAGWCSGTLINNTMGDGTAYFLTANHCAEGTTTQYFNYFEIYFHYECPYCTCTSEPGMITYTGVTKIANSPISGGSDFLLLKLKNANWSKLKNDGLILNGWSKSASPSSSGVCIHHPAGDVKKISTYNTTLTSGTFIEGTTQETGATNAYWVVPWATTTHGRSVTEGGSSGSPLFNSNGLVVGTLTGGSSTCDYPNAREYYGKMSYHWSSAGTTDNTRLQPWLDPVPLSQTTCPILDLNSSFYVMPAAHIFSANGATFNYLIYCSNQSWTLTYQNDHSWLTVNNESGYGDNAIQVTCQPNTGTTTRRCNLLITKEDGSTFQVIVKQASATGISVIPENEFSVYPNPAHDQINIESVEHFISKVEIIDMLGKVVYSENFNGYNSLIIPVSHLNDAMYLMRLTTVNNEVVYKKFSKN